MKDYENAEMEIVRFVTKDIVTASPPDNETGF